MGQILRLMQQNGIIQPIGKNEQKKKKRVYLKSIH